MKANTIKKDCFAFNNEKQECNACKDLRCHHCSFYKKSKRNIKKYKKEFTFADYTLQDVCQLFSKQN